jgi:hypothetical protein
MKEDMSGIRLASFAVIEELCANVALFLTTDSFLAKLAKDRKARKDGRRNRRTDNDSDAAGRRLKQVSL